MGIKHIEFWVKDLSKSLKFYKSLFKILGWKNIETSGFVNKDTKIYFVKKDINLQKSLGPRHICFLAKNKTMVNKIGNFLQTQKYQIIRGPILSKYKNRNSFTVDFYDPNGYILEVATKSKVNKS